MIEQAMDSQERVVVLRTLSHDEAKEEIVRLFKAGEVLDYGDIVDQLGIDLQVAVEICRELESEGVIEESQ